MNPKPLAFIFVRLNGFLMLFYAIYELTFLPTNIRIVTLAEGAEPFYSEAITDLFMLILRCVLQVMIGCTLIAKTNKVINFLIADLAEEEKREKEESEN